MGDINENPQGHNTETSTPVAETIGAGVVPATAVPQEPAQSSGQSTPRTGGQNSVSTGETTDPEQTSAGEEDTATDTVDSLGYDEVIDHPAIQGVANMFKEAGVKAEDALKLFEKAISSNNVSDIDESGVMKALGSTVGPMVLSVMKGVFYENKQRAEGIKNKFLTVVGGETAWSSIRQWVHDNESKDPEFKTMVDGYRTLLEKDEASALLVANALKSMYRDANVTRKPSAFVQGDPRAAAIGISPILDINEFGRMYSKARRDNNAGEADQILARWRMGGGKNYK